MATTEQFPNKKYRPTFGERNDVDMKSRNASQTLDLRGLGERPLHSDHVIDLSDHKDVEQKYDTFFEAIPAQITQPIRPSKRFGDDRSFRDLGDSEVFQTTKRDRLRGAWLGVAGFFGAISANVYRALHHRRYRPQRRVAKRISIAGAAALAAVGVGLIAAGIFHLPGTDNTAQHGQTQQQSGSSSASGSQNNQAQPAAPAQATTPAASTSSSETAGTASSAGVGGATTSSTPTTNTTPVGGSGSGGGTTATPGAPASTTVDPAITIPGIGTVGVEVTLPNLGGLLSP